MKRSARLVCLLLAMLYVLAPVALAADNHMKALDSVVRIYGEFTLQMYIDNIPAMSMSFHATGTGFAIGKKGEAVDTFVTNRHVVVPDAESIRRSNGFPEQGTYEEDGERFFISYGMETNGLYVVFDDLSSKKEVVRTIISDNYDLAVVKLVDKTSARKPATIAVYDTLPKEMSVWTMGFPGVTDVELGGGQKLESLPSSLNICRVESGSVQMIADNDVFGSYVDHSAEINPGNSGGPLVDENGLVVGVNTWTMDLETTKLKISQTTRQLKQFLNSENITAEYARRGGLPMATILIIACAAAVIVVIFVLALMSGRKRERIPIVDANGSRKLVVVGGSLRKDTNYSLVAGRKLTIGTDGAQCNLAFPKGTPGVSHVHCSVSFDGRTVIVKDENSRYGTYIDAQKLEPGRETVLHRGHKLGIGSQKESLILR